jgi:hypothetical protein
MAWLDAAELDFVSIPEFIVNLQHTYKYGGGGG